MKILLFSSNTERSEAIKQHLLQASYPKVVCVEGGSDMPEQVRQHAPAIIIIAMATPDKTTLETMREIDREMPKPIVFFADYSDYDTTQAIIDAGVSAYIVNTPPDNRIKTLIEVATARFHASHRLRSELESYKQQLEDRKDIDKAKGFLMQHRQLSEEAAYQALRKMAMDRNMRMGDAARNFIAAMSLLGETV